MLNLKRYEGNPVLAPREDIPWMTTEARNTAATVVGDEVHLLFTAGSHVEDGGEMVLGHAVSTDGRNFEIDPEPWFERSPNRGDFDHGTVEDPRITKIDDTYFICYCARAFHYGRRDEYPEPNELGTGLCWNHQHARRVGLLISKDMKTYEKVGPLTNENHSDGNGCFFPKKIGGKYCFLHRPTPFMANPWTALYYPAGIWMAASEDYSRYDMFAEGTDHRIALPAYEWEALKIGASGPPIETDEGWLVIYHGVSFPKPLNNGLGVYSTGLMLLDLEHPTKIIARSPEPILKPETDIEVNGRVPNVVFPCGNPVIDGVVHIYYGTADTCTNLATVELQEMLDYILTCKL